MCEVIWDIRQKYFLQCCYITSQGLLFLHFCRCPFWHLDSGVLLVVSDGERRYSSKSYLRWKEVALQWSWLWIYVTLSACTRYVELAFHVLLHEVKDLGEKLVPGYSIPGASHRAMHFPWHGNNSLPGKKMLNNLSDINTPLFFHKSINNQGYFQCAADAGWDFWRCWETTSSHSPYLPLSIGDCC